MSVSRKDLIKIMENWTKQLKTFKENMENLNPTDRLNFVAAINECHGYLVVTTNAWRKWIRNPGIMNKFPTEELKLLLEGFKNVVNSALDLDIEWSKKGIELWEAEIKEALKDQEDLPYVG